jgi:hypothetical protein
VGGGGSIPSEGARSRPRAAASVVVAGIAVFDGIDDEPP